jgi:hypothetical protein
VKEAENLYDFRVSSLTIVTKPFKSRSRANTNSANSFIPAHDKPQDKPKDYKLEDRNLQVPRNLQVHRPWHVYGISVQQQKLFTMLYAFPDGTNSRN